MIDFFHVPEGSSFLFSYQTLCASTIALFAAILAYKAARYSADAEADRKRSLVLNYCASMAEKLDLDVDFYEESKDEDSEGFVYLLQFCEIISSYDITVFSNKYLQSLRKQEQSTLIKVKMNINILQENADKCMENVSQLHDGKINEEYHHRYCDLLRARGEALKALCGVTSKLINNNIENF